MTTDNELTAIYDNVPFALCVVDNERRILHANRGLSELTGIPVEKLTGGSACGVFGCIHTKEDPRGCSFGSSCEECSLRKAIERTFESGNPCTGIERHFILERDGSRRNLLVSGSTALFKRGDSTLLLLCLQDITEKKEGEQLLLEAKERLHLAIESAGDGVWDWNIPYGTILFSRLYMEMLGYESDELPNHFDTWKNSVHPDDIERAMKELQDCIAGRIAAYNAELRLRCKNGSYKWILCRGSIVKRDSKGNPVRMTGIHTDISKAKAVEEELSRARESAERANQAKSDFFSSMSHELRTPLNAVLGFGQILEMDKDLNDSQKDYVKEILNGGRQLLELITEVLDLASEERGKMELIMEPLSCRKIIKECLDIVVPLLEKSSLSVELDDDLNIDIRADRIRIKQVLHNLLSNAIKYNHPGGTIRIDVNSNKGRVCISVTDSGRGIPSENMKNLFKPFNRLGSGIGLSFSKKLVEQMGGTIGAESTYGEGSNFWIELPELEEVPA